MRPRSMIDAGAPLLAAAGLLVATALNAMEVSWSPASPTLTDAVVIGIRPCAQGGFLHWGVNAKGNQWQSVDPAYRPEGSTADGIAARTRLDGPDADGVCRVTLGPFSGSTQAVGSVDFAIFWDDGSWDSRNGLDYHIPISQGRISVRPEAPTFNDVVRVVVHRSRPGGLLRWGVNAEHGRWTPPHADYQPEGTAPSDDGLAVDSPLPAPDEHGDSVITLGPFNSGFQVVTSLHLAVHWGQEWDANLGRNYNVPLRTDPEAPELALAAPRDEELFSGDFTALVASPAGEPVTLWLNRIPVVTLLREPFEWRAMVSALPHGRHAIVARAEREGRAALAQAAFWYTPAVQSRPPPSGTRFGAAADADGFVTFALHAPGKRFVSLIGDFNAWDPLADVMDCSADGTWWIRRRLDPGEHRYQYLVDGSLRIADPYATDVEWKDEQGEETHYPELARSVIAVGAPPHAWGDASFRRPPLDSLLVYECFIEDLCPGEGFTGVIARLDYIRDLGANAIEPLPWTECAGARGWGYNPAFHFAPETGYGTPDDLKRLVDAAHARGIAVIMDVVLNHMGGEAPLHQLYGPDYDRSPYFHLFLGENWGMPDLDQESEVFKGYASDMLAFWVREYHVDGFRYDATRWVGWQGYNDWGASWFAYAAKQAEAGSYQVAEHLPTDPLLMNTTEMDAGWHAHFRWRLRDMLRSASLDTNEFRRIMEPREGGFNHGFQRVAYSESHDEERVVRELVEAGYSEEEALRRAEAALAVTLTAPGVTMIYAGQEWGESTAKRVGPNPLHWPLLEEPARRRLYQRTRALARLRTSHPALQADALRFLELDAERGLAVYERVGPGQSIVVAVNFGPAARELALRLPFTGRWTDVLNERNLEGTTGTLAVLLEGGQARVWAGEVLP